MLHLIPSGILHGRACIVGNGVVVEPEQLFAEIADLEQKGAKVAGHLFVSERANVVFPYHKAVDRAAEAKRGDTKIGTTGRGIGPCYADKYSRTGIRVVDLYDRELFEARLKANVEEKNGILAMLGGELVEFEKIRKDYADYAKRLKPYVTDTIAMVNDAIDAKKRVLFEAGLAAGHRLRHLPHVTSSIRTPPAFPAAPACPSGAWSR